MRWEGHVALTEEIRNAYEILVGKPEGKRPRGIPTRGRWESNIRTYLKEIRSGGMDWIHLAQARRGVS